MQGRVSSSAAAGPAEIDDPPSGFSEKPLTPHMGERDLARFYTLMSRATNYREFGAGGSTVQAVGFPNIKKVVSTESDPAWIGKIKTRRDVQQALTNKRLVLEHGNIGAVVEWGNPGDDSQKERWPAYSDLNNSRAEFNPPFSFDLVFVDGRFRVACFLKALSAITPERRSSTWLAMHDYIGEREVYHVVEQYAVQVPIRYPDDIDEQWIAKAKSDVFASVGDDVLGIFQKRADVDAEKLNAAIRKYELLKAL